MAELHAQHIAETGERFESDAVALAFELTRGQPQARQRVAVDDTPCRA